MYSMIIFETLGIISIAFIIWNYEIFCVSSINFGLICKLLANKSTK